MISYMFVWMGMSGDWKSLKSFLVFLVCVGHLGVLFWLGVLVLGFVWGFVCLLLLFGFKKPSE